MGTRILRGRALSEEDRDGAPLVFVISESMARKIWPKEEALGKCLRFDRETAPCSTVVGIAEDIVWGSLGDDDGAEYYGSSAQFNAGGGGLYVRAHGKAEPLTNDVRRELQREMPGVSYVTVKPLSQVLAPNVRPWRLGATMFALFGGLALLLAAVGLYSVIAYNVTQRSHELGVRIALGAQAPDVLRLVVGSGVRVSIAGIAIGGGIALLAGRFIAPLLYRVSPRDPAVFVVVTATLLAVAMLASLLPALRATKVDPNVALRVE